MWTYLGIQNFGYEELVVVQLVPFLEKLLLEVLGSDVAEARRGLGVDLGLHIDDIRDVPLVVLVVLEELREVLGVRSVFPGNGGH
jgi:hypothetical protein